MVHKKFALAAQSVPVKKSGHVQVIENPMSNGADYVLIMAIIIRTSVTMQL